MISDLRIAGRGLRRTPAFRVGVGIYGVSSCLATQQRHEIGVRMALGAQFADIVKLTYRGVLLPSVVGLMVGAGAAVWLTQLLKSLIFRVSTGDLRTLALAVLTLLTLALLAATCPALRAASRRVWW